jgi:hypothetical protein
MLKIRYDASATRRRLLSQQSQAVTSAHQRFNLFGEVSSFGKLRRVYVRIAICHWAFFFFCDFRDSARSGWHPGACPPHADALLKHTYMGQAESKAGGECLQATRTQDISFPTTTTESEVIDHLSGLLDQLRPYNCWIEPHWHRGSCVCRCRGQRLDEQKSSLVPTEGLKTGRPGTFQCWGASISRKRGLRLFPLLVTCTRAMRVDSTPETVQRARGSSSSTAATRGRRRVSITNHLHSLSQSNHNCIPSRYVLAIHYCPF